MGFFIKKLFFTSIFNSCLQLSKNKCLTKKNCVYKDKTKRAKRFKIQSDEMDINVEINKARCSFKIEDRYYDLFLNKLVDEILRSNLKRRSIIGGRFN